MVHLGGKVLFTALANPAELLCVVTRWLVLQNARCCFTVFIADFVGVSQECRWQLQRFADLEPVHALTGTVLELAVVDQFVLLLVIADR